MDVMNGHHRFLGTEYSEGKYKEFSFCVHMGFSNSLCLEFQELLLSFDFGSIISMILSYCTFLALSD